MNRADDLGIVARLRAAAELYDLALAMMRQKIRRTSLVAGEDEVTRRLLDWRLHRPDAPDGDGVGRLVPIPRPRQ